MYNNYYTHGSDGFNNQKSGYCPILNTSTKGVKEMTETNNKRDSLNDRRTRFTRNLIQNVYMDLLEEGKKKISVAELCKIAGVSRGTFYLHYKDVADVREKLEDEFFETVIRATDDVMNEKIIGHEKEFLEQKCADRRWMLLYYGETASNAFHIRTHKYIVAYLLENKFKDKRWTNEQKRVAALILSVGCLAIDRDAAIHPWVQFEKVNSFYDHMIRTISDIVFSADTF